MASKIIWAAILVALNYFMFSFFVLDLNPKNWSEGWRVACGCASALWIWLYVATNY